MSHATGREKGEEDQTMPKRIVIPLHRGGNPIEVVDVDRLYPGDEVEWTSGGLDVTLDFGGTDIFGQATLRIPANTPSATLTVQPGAPVTQQRPYTILDNGSGQNLYRPGGARSHPVMIFGP